MPLWEQNAKRLEDEQQLKRNVEERKREKEEEARARERIRAKLGALAGSPQKGVQGLSDLKRRSAVWGRRRCS